MDSTQDKVERAVNLFMKRMGRVVARSCRGVRNREVTTPWGSFSLPLIASFEGRTVAFDFEGSDTTPLSVADFRDGLILGSGQVQAIYRLHARDVRRHPEEVVYGVSLWDPYLFSERGHNIAKSDASGLMVDRVQEWGWPLPGGCKDYYVAVVPYSEGDEFRMERHALLPSGRDNWSSCFQFAQNFGPGTFEEVCSAWNKRFPLSDDVE